MEEESRLAFVSTTVKLRTQPVPPISDLERELERAEEEYKRRGRDAAYDLFKARRALRLARLVGRDGTLEARVSALRLTGSVAVLFLPSEVFVEHQLYVKARSPFRNTLVTLVATYADGYFGYVLTAEAYGEGGYEAEFPITILARGEGERLREEALSLLEKLV